MMNVNGSRFIDTGATHYLYILKYDDVGFYFYDSYYWPSTYYNATDYEEAFQPSFMSFNELDSLWKNVLQSNHIIGIIQSLIGLNKFAIVLDETGNDNLSFLTKFSLIIHYRSENILEGIARVVMFFSPRV